MKPGSHSTFSKNRERLLKQEIADRFFAVVVKQAHLRRYISGEHFSVDGTLLEAWASHKSFRPKDDGDKGGPPAWDGTRRSTTTGSDGATRPTSRPPTLRRGWLARGTRWRPSSATRAPAHGEPECVDRGHGAERGDGLRRARDRADLAAAAAEECPATNGGRGQGYDTRDFVAGCREIGVTPHVAQNTTHRRSAIDGRTTRHAGHVTSLRIRKRIEDPSVG